MSDNLQQETRPTEVHTSSTWERCQTLHRKAKGRLFNAGIESGVAYQGFRFAEMALRVPSPNETTPDLAPYFGLAVLALSAIFAGYAVRNLIGGAIADIEAYRAEAAAILAGTLHDQTFPKRS